MKMTVGAQFLREIPWYFLNKKEVVKDYMHFFRKFSRKHFHIIEEQKLAPTSLQLVLFFHPCN